MAEARIIIVGGGLAGLMAAIRVGEKGGKVLLFSVVPVKRSHSVCAQGGINGAVNTKGEGDSVYKHFDDSVYGGDFLANQPPVMGMAAAAPGIVYMLDRMGVPFNRTPEGLAEAHLRAIVLTSLLAFLIVSNIGFPWRLASTGCLFALGLALLAASDSRLQNRSIFLASRFQ